MEREPVRAGGELLQGCRRIRSLVKPVAGQDRCLEQAISRGPFPALPPLISGRQRSMQGSVDAEEITQGAVLLAAAGLRFLEGHEIVFRVIDSIGELAGGRPVE